MMGNNIIADNLKVLVFSSNIDTPAKVKQIRKALLANDQIYQVNVDLDDIDNVLRVECHPRCKPELVNEKITRKGFHIDILI